MQLTEADRKLAALFRGPKVELLPVVEDPAIAAADIALDRAKTHPVSIARRLDKLTSDESQVRLCMKEFV